VKIEISVGGLVVIIMLEKSTSSAEIGRDRSLTSCIQTNRSASSTNLEALRTSCLSAFLELMFLHLLSALSLGAIHHDIFPISSHSLLGLDSLSI